MSCTSSRKYLEYKVKGTSVPCSEHKYARQYRSSDTVPTSEFLALITTKAEATSAMRRGKNNSLLVDKYFCKNPFYEIKNNWCKNLHRLFLEVGFSVAN